MKKLFLVVLCFLVLVGCSSDDNAANASDTEGSILTKGTATFNNGTVFTSRYTYEGRRLVKIATDDRYTVYDYSGERITKAETYNNNNGLVGTVLFEYYPNGKIKRSLTTLSSGNVISYVYAYNEDGSVAVTRYIGSEIAENIDNIGYLYFENGEMFDTSYESVAKAYGKFDHRRADSNGYQPFPFEYGKKDGLIPGFIEGIEQLSFGDKATIFIPSRLGYGEAGAGGVIPPNANIIFEIELLEKMN